MELLVTDQYFIVVDGERTLWINRQTQNVSAKIGANNEITDATCLGTVHGYLGKINFGTGLDTRLIFIRQKASVGVLDGCEIYKILSVVSIPLETDVELTLEGCERHGHSPGDQSGNPQLQQDCRIRSPASIEYTGQRNLFKVKAGPPTPTINAERVSPLLRKNDRMDKVEKKIVDEFHKMFTDADSFYYSLKYDLSNTVQRQYYGSEKRTQESNSALQNADSRFIWNYHMFSDLIQSEETGVRQWILPMIHGFIEHGRCSLDLDDGPPSSSVEKRDHIDLWLISRRSRFRAGTRYLRRGIDEGGKVANYVETEQIMIFQHHKTSFVQVRGSIPLYWSQSSQRYRPTPCLDRSEEETFVAFQKHFQEERSLYGPVVIVNLVDKGGKEKILGDAYLSNVLSYNSPDVTYLSFDFHEHCRGMHFENVALVISRLDDVFNTMSYCWVDSYGIVLQQKGVLRVNCVDCLDRTNLTQTQFGRHVLEGQLSKLGLLAPEIGLAKNIKTKLQTMWANNGDTISKQYAGTNALKGDFTRTGERKLAGALKDGMNSASRYYLNRFRDTYRQAAIDITMGERKTLTEDDLDDGKAGEEKEATTEQIRTVIEDVKKCVVPKDAVILGAWCFVNAKKNAVDELDIDTIFIVTEESCFTTDYDCSMDSIMETEVVNLKNLTAIELGFQKTTLPTNFLSFLSTTITHTTNTMFPCLRISHNRDGAAHYHEFLSSNIQFINNSAVHLQQPEEMFESLKLVAEAVQAAAENISNPIKLNQNKSLAVRADNPKPLTSSHSSVGFGLLNFHTVDQSDKQHTTKPPDNFTPPTKIRRSSDVALPKANLQLTGAEPLKFVHQESEKLLFPTSASGAKQKGDFVLASCGVVSSCSSANVKADEEHNARIPSSNSNLPTVNTVKSSFEVSCETKTAIVVSPIDASATTPQAEAESPTEQPPSNSSVVFRHRMSLPASSIEPDLPGRSITPEIKITEVQQNSAAQLGDNHNSKLAIPAMTKRMSRSSEDMSSDLEIDEHSEGFGVGNQKLSPTFSKDNRSSSIQNLFNSALNMKSSRSENTILAPARPNPTRIAAMNPLSKDSVLVPLGKLARGMQKGANYFDPRKLKDTFKQSGRNLQEEAQRKEDRELLLALEEKKKQCRSLIIEI